MMMLKRCLNNLVAVFAVIAALSSCNNQSAIVPLPQQQAAYTQPVSLPLEFGKPHKLDWAGAKIISVHPLVKKFSIDDLPSHPYDSLLYKPFSKPVTTWQLNLNSLPANHLDLDKLPAKPLVYKTYLLPQPKLIKVGMPALKDPANPFIYELGDVSGVQGRIRYEMKDHDGFIWILTTRSLYRYDGENLLLYIALDEQYQEYQYCMQDDQGRFWLTYNSQVEIVDIKKGIFIKTDGGVDLTNDVVVRVFEDKQQHIWLTYFSGNIAVVNSKTLTVKLITTAQGLKKFAYAFAQDVNNKIWLPTIGSGLEVIDLKNKNIKTVNKTDGLALDSVTAVTIDHTGKIWMAYMGGVIDVIDPVSGAVQRIHELENFHGELFISEIKEDRSGRMLASTDDGLDIIDFPKRSMKHLSTVNGLAGDNIRNSLEDNAGQLWVAASKGISILNQDVHITAHIGKTVTTSSYQDDQGLVWLASPANGIDIYDVVHKTYRHMGKAEGISHDSIQFVKVLKGLILIGTFKGLEIIDPLKKTFTHLDKTQGFSNDVINCVSVDSKGKLWIGGYGNGVDIYDPQHNLMKHIGKNEGFNDKDMTDVTFDNYGRVWISSSKGGTSVMDTAKGTVKALNNIQGLSSFPKSFAKDKEGNIWINSDKGLFAIDQKKNKMLLSSAVYGDRSVFNILAHNSTIYAADYNGLTAITPPSGGINAGGDWQIESCGINKVNRGYFQTDAVGCDGSYWWGDTGFTVIDLSKKDNYQPSLFVAGISIMDTPRYFVSKNNLRQTDTLWAKGNDEYVTGDNIYGKMNWLKTSMSYDSVAGPFNLPLNLSIPYNQNYLRFNFTSFGKAGADSTLYRYVLIGADKKWSDITEATSTRTYYGLAPGKYTFEVSRLSNNKWQQPAVFSFTISPPWWQTWWAYIIYIVVFACVVWGLVYYRSKQLVKTNRQLEHKIRLRTEEVLQQKEEIEAQRDHLEVAVNDLKQTQAQLVQSEKLASLGELTAGIAHEIQNPLNFVNNFSEVNTELIDEMKDEIAAGNYEEVKTLADDIKQNQQKINYHGKRADAIVKNMLQHSRNNSGEKQLTDVNALADEYLRLSYHGLRAKDKSFNAEMITNFDADVPKLNIIPQDIGRVLLNLFNNAFYAVNHKKKTAGKDYKPTITLSTFIPPSGGWGVTVKDNGNGIPDDVKDKIMQPFFTTKPTGEGTGLGLSLSYDIVVKGHNGQIDVDTKEGEYTVFIITLPA